MAVLGADNLANIAGGPGWFYYTADLTPAVPAKLDDVIALATPYTPKTGWIFGGALTRSAITAAFNMTQADVSTAHTNVPVAKRVTATTRSLAVPFQEVSPAIQQLSEDTPASVAIAVGAGGSGTSAQTAVPVGSVQRLTQRRIAMIIERDPGVTGVYGESGARGLLFGFLAPRVVIAATGSNQVYDPDTTSERLVTFDFLAETTVTDPRAQHGRWVFETGLVVP